MEESEKGFMEEEVAETGLCQQAAERLGISDTGTPGCTTGITDTLAESRGGTYTRSRNRAAVIKMTVFHPVILLIL